MAVQRSERIRCHLPCEIVSRRRKVAATLCGLSEKGFSLVTRDEVEQGDAIRVSILPHRGRNAIVVDAIAWSNHERHDRVSGRSRREVGFLLSDPSPAYLALLDEVRRRAAPPTAGAGVEVRATPASDRTLPRPRSPLPPPKPDEEDALPRFRVRLKDGGSPRSRSATLRARSAQEAERRACEELGATWEVLEVTRLRD